jgi:peptide/nickel transport system substrate-binding protein
LVGAYEPLIVLTQQGGLKPGLATSWKLGPGNRSITFTLRHNARFSDGTSVNAQAVKTWVEYAITQPGAATFSGPVKSVKVLSHWVVRVNVTASDPMLALAFSPFEASTIGLVASPKAVALAKKGPASKDYLNTHTDGAGPYIYDASQSNLGDTCVFVPNKYYYDQSAIKWAKVKYIGNIVNNSSILAAMETGQIQIATGDYTTAASAKSAGFHVLYSTGRPQGISFINRGKGPLANLKVRQALNYAVNRREIATSLWGPQSVASDNPNPESDGDNPATDNYYKYNVTKAKQLLNQAGYPHGFTFSCYAFGPWLPYDDLALAQAVASQLAVIGVTMNILSTPTATNYPKTYDAISSIYGTDPTWYWYQIYLAPGGAYSSTNWSDPVLVKLWNQGAKATGNAATRIWRQLLDRTITQADFVPIGSPGFFTYVAKSVGGATHINDGAYSVLDGWYPVG